MIESGCSILTDLHGRELRKKGLQFMGLQVNEGDIHQFAAGHIPSHWHKELEIFMLLEGCIQICIGDSTYQLQGGEGCFINTQVIHSFTAVVSSPCRYQSFVFTSDLVGGTPGSVFDTAYVRPLLENGAPFLRFQETSGDQVYFEQFRRAFTVFAGESYGYEFQVRDALSHILLHIKSKSNLAPNRTIPSIQETRLKEMLTWIDDHLGKTISVSEIAGIANICPRECQRIFHQYLHYSPIEYVQRKRILAAAKELSVTDLPVTDIALNCGFPSPSYFSKQFKAIIGNTPRQYRAAVRERAPLFPSDSLSELPPCPVDGT